MEAGLGGTLPARHRSRGLPDWLGSFRGSREAEAWPADIEGGGREGVPRLCSLCFSFSFPTWSPRRSWKEARQARNLKVWVLYSLTSAEAEQSSPSLKIWGSLTLFPLLGGGEEQVPLLGPPGPWLTDVLFGFLSK